MSEWQKIETAPKDKILLLGYCNSHGNWRTLRGGWITKDEIDEDWDDPEEHEAGWYEISVEADDEPSCWFTAPTHWMPLPSPPTGGLPE